MRAAFGLVSLTLCVVAFGQQPAEDIPGLVHTLDGHSETVYAAGFSPDGKIAATGSFDQTIKLWDPATGKALRTYGGPQGHQKLVLALAFSAQGDKLASGGSDNKAIIWDVPTDSPLRDLAQNSEVNDLAISPDNKRLATACKDGTVKVWDAENNQQLFNMTGHVGEATGVWFSGNNQLLASCGADQTVRIWNATDGQAAATIIAHPSIVEGVIFSPNNTQVFTAGEDGVVRCWQVPPQPTRKLEPHGGPITALTLANDGNQLLTAGDDKIVRWSNFGNGQKVRDLAGADAEILSVAMSPNNQIAAAGLKDGHVALWQGDGKLLGRFQAHSVGVTGVSFNGASNVLATVGDDGVLKQWRLPINPKKELKHNAAVTTAELRQDGQRLVTGSADKVVRLWRLDNNTVEREFPGHAGTPVAVSVAPNGQFLISADDTGVIKLWNAGNAQVAAEYGGHAGKITSLSYSPRNDRVASTGEDGLLKLWQLPPQEVKKMDHPQPVRGVAMSPDGNRVATVCDDKHVRLWNLGNGQQERAVNAGGQAITAFAINWDNAGLAAASADNTIRVWDGGGTEVAKIEKLPGGVTSLAFHPDRQRFAAGLSDNSVRVYQISDGMQLQEIKGHTSPAVTLAYSPDGQTLFSGSGDKTVRTWNAADGTAKAQLAQPAEVVGLSVTRNGKHLTVATADKQIQVWTPADGKVVAKATTPAEVRGVALSDDGKVIAAACADGLVRTFGEDGQLRETFRHDAEVTGVAIHPDNKRIVSVSADKSAKFWTASLVAQAKSAGPVRLAAFTPNGNSLLSVGDDKFLRVWDVNSGAMQKEIAAHDAAVLGLSISGDSAYALTVGADKKAKLWNIGTGNVEMTADLPGLPESVALTPDRQRFAVATVEGDARQVVTFDAGGQTLRRLATPGAAVPGLGFAPDNRTLMIAGQVTDLTDTPVFRAWPAHPGGATAVVFHPNNVHAFTAGKDKTVRQWDMNAGKELRAFGPTAEPITSLALSRDFTQVAAGFGKTLQIWNAGDGNAIATIEHPAAVTSAAFSGDKTRIVTGASDGLARVWEVNTGKQLEAFSYGAAVTGVAYHPNQQFVAVGSADKAAAVHPVSIFRLIAASDKPIRAFTLHQNPGYVLTGDDAGAVKAWNVGNGNAERDFQGAAAPVRCVATSKNGQVVAAGCDDKKIRLYRFDNAQLISEITSPEVPHSLAFHPDGKSLVAGLADKRVQAWNVAYNLGQAVPAEFGLPIQSFPHAGTPTAVQFDNAGKLFSGSLDKTVKEWTIASAEPVKNIGLPNLVDSVAFSPDGKLLATGCHDGRIRLHDVEKGNQIRQIDAHTQPQADPVYAIAFSPNGQQLVSGCFNGSLKIWNVADGNMVREMKGFTPKEAEKGHRSGVFCVAWSPDGRFIASGSSDRSLKLWDANSGDVVREFANPNFKESGVPGSPEAHPGWIYQVRYIENGAKLISAGAAPRFHGYVGVWDVADGKLLGAMDAPTGYIHGLGVSPDAGQLILGCGPKDRGVSEGSAVIVKTPGK